jgi:MurNAc alpha-1-phosphate uridylyltransferase
MRPITDSIPKPLVKIKGKAILDYSLEKINKIASIKKIFINGFYLANQIEDHLKNLNNSKIIFSHEEQKIETAGAIYFARDKIDLTQPLLLVNGDTLWQEANGKNDIEFLCENWQENSSDILLGLKKSIDYQGREKKGNGTYGDFDLKGRKLYRFKDQEMSHDFVGMQIINPKIVMQAGDNLENKCFSMGVFYKNLDNNSRLQNVEGVELPGNFFHIGTVDAIVETEKKIR